MMCSSSRSVWTKLYAVMVSVLVITVVSATANADILNTTGVVTEIAAPVSVDTNVREDSTILEVFREQDDLTLTSDEIVDVWTAGTYQNADIVGAPVSSITAGTEIDVFMLHMDILSSESTSLVLSGSITFDCEILGVMLRDSSLYASDDIGNAATLYPTGDSYRGSVEWEALDTVTLSADMKTITFNLLVDSVHTDQIRIITEAEGAVVPEPSTMAVILLGGITAMIRRRRRNTAK